MDADTERRVDIALRAWVDKRKEQAEASAKKGRAQEGRRSAVTGGLHLEGLNQLVVDQIRATGAKNLELLTNKKATLAGFYRASKSWDLVVLEAGTPVLAVEYKSMSGSESNNLNNRADEIFGMAEDARQAEKHKILPPNMRRAYVFIMAINPDSTKPVKVQSGHGKPDPVFTGASYLQRTAIMCRRMRDTGLFHMSWAVGVHEDPFYWRESDESVGWERFATDLRSAFTGGSPTPNPELAPGEPALSTDSPAAGTLF